MSVHFIKLVKLEQSHAAGETEGSLVIPDQQQISSTSL